MQESTLLLDNASLEVLRAKKNLLAFSGGVDSSALFFLLKDAGIEFDIALVNYNTRESSKDEEEYANKLGREHIKKCFVKSVKLPKKDFEAAARESRYGFFEEIIKKHGYDNLITAHQLNDKLEWFLMRLSKGAGLKELSGMKNISKRDGYTLIRPLLKTEKSRLYEYLKKHDIKYFEDESNLDKTYERNYFRHEFSQKFLSKFANGVARSFEILDIEATLFESDFFIFESIVVFKSISKKNDEYNAVSALKYLGYLPSYAQRKDISNKFDCVVGGSFCVAKDNAGYVFVAPYAKTTMQKEFKEKCRLSAIPSKARGYLASLNINPKKLRADIDYFFGDIGGFK